jgi:predicted aspartyl protease
MPVPAHAADTACQLKRVTTLELVPGAGVPLVDVTMGGQKRRLVVDTGAFWSHAFKATVKELGLPIIQATTIASVSADGSRSSEYVRIPDLVIGNARAGNREFMVDGSSDPNDTIGEGGVAGLLGAEILKQFDIDFDFAADKLNIFSQDHCPGKVTYWNPTAVAVVPFRMDDGSHITFPVKVNGKRMMAVLDTGFSNTTVNQSVAERSLEFDEDSPEVEKVGDVNGKADIYQTRLKSIEIEGMTIANPMINVFPDLAAKSTRRSQIGSLIPQSDVSLPPIILGMSTLQKLHVYIAYKERKLYLSQAAETAEPAAVPGPQ